MSPSNLASRHGSWPNARRASRSRDCIVWRGVTQRRCSKRSEICGRRLRPSWAAQLTWCAALRLAGMDSGCTDCWPRMGSPLTCWSRRASWSTDVRAGPKPTGSTRRVCCACSPPGWLAIGRCAAWCGCRHRTRRMPSDRTVSASTWCRIGCASRTASRHCCSRKVSARAPGAG